MACSPREVRGLVMAAPLLALRARALRYAQLDLRDSCASASQAPSPPSGSASTLARTIAAISKRPNTSSCASDGSRPGSPRCARATVSRIVARSGAHEPEGRAAERHVSRTLRPDQATVCCDVPRRCLNFEHLFATIGGIIATARFTTSRRSRVWLPRTSSSKVRASTTSTTSTSRFLATSSSSSPACPVAARARLRSTPSTRRASAATSRASRATQGSSSARWRSQTSTVSTASPLPSPSTRRRPTRTPAPRLQPSRRSTTTCDYSTRAWARRIAPPVARSSSSRPSTRSWIRSCRSPWASALWSWHPSSRVAKASSSPSSRT